MQYLHLHAEITTSLSVPCSLTLASPLLLHIVPNLIFSAQHALKSIICKVCGKLRGSKLAYAFEVSIHSAITGYCSFCRKLRSKISSATVDKETCPIQACYITEKCYTMNTYLHVACYGTVIIFILCTVSTFVKMAGCFCLVMSAAAICWLSADCVNFRNSVMLVLFIYAKKKKLPVILGTNQTNE